MNNGYKCKNKEKKKEKRKIKYLNLDYIIMRHIITN